MSPSTTLMLLAFLAATSLVGLAAILVSGRNRRMEGRIETLASRGKTQARPESSNSISQVVLPALGSPLVPASEKERTHLRSRLMHAGFYSRQAMVLFLGVKMLFMVVPIGLGMLSVSILMIPFQNGILFGLIGSGVGMLLPSLWLDSRKTKRQGILRRSLPDFLDMIVVSLRGGLSLQSAFQRVSDELAMAHPELAAEFNINVRETRLGLSTGEAMRHFADRCDLEEIRSLASVLVQAEQLGASSTQTLRVHADTLRLKRLQKAEELAHTAATKMVFPTILCIFPCIMIVIVGPAAIQIAEMFSQK